MKQLIRIAVLCAATAALALGTVTGAGAGIPEVGDVVITPNPVDVGGTVTISNAANEDSLCEDQDGEDVFVEMIIYPISDPDNEFFVSAEVDEDGNWSTTFTVPNDDSSIGEWEVDAGCFDDEINDVGVLTEQPFLYNLGTFEVVAPLEPIVPDDGTEAAEEVRTEPRFTG